MLYSILVSLDVLIAATLIGLVLLQQGKGASAGAAFGGGGGASGTVFGARGSSSFMTRATAVLAAAFFINSIVLAYLASNRTVAESVMESAVMQEQQIDVPTDVPGVVNIPEGTSSEEMMEILKTEIEKKSSEKAAEGTEAANTVIENAEDAAAETAEDVQKMIKENADQSMPADIPQ